MKGPFLAICAAGLFGGGCLDMPALPRLRRPRPAQQPPAQPASRPAEPALVPMPAPAPSEPMLPPVEPGQLEVDLEPLPVQQAKAYPETATGRFLSLADFEDTPYGNRGSEQVGHFTTDGRGRTTPPRFVVTPSRTGAGALGAVLRPGDELVFHIPYACDMSAYTLLSMALHSETLRDDLRVMLVGEKGTWTSHGALVREGWNTVLIDIQRLGQAGGFDTRRVRRVHLCFANAAGEVGLALDDVMLIDNRRAIEPVPPGCELSKNGLDYLLRPAGRNEQVSITQSPDGLWRLGDQQGTIQLARRDGKPPVFADALEVMGARRVGLVELVEHNPIRLRLANTWYFPSRRGEWASLAVRRIVWEHTFYADGRWATHLTLNNAGGADIAAVRIRLPAPAAWHGGAVADTLEQRDFAGTAGRWSYLLAPPGDDQGLHQHSFHHPARLDVKLGGLIEQAGHPARDGFDERQGCYVLVARRGNCRFTVVPGAAGPINPVFRVVGPWDGPVRVSSEGLAVREVVKLPDGSALFRLPGKIDRPTAVEVVGEPTD